MRLVSSKSTELIESSALNPRERVLACCRTAREKLDLGDYDAGCAALQPWWTIGEWPRHAGLTDDAAAELLLTAGTLTGWVASTKEILGGQKPAEGLLSGALTLFEQLGETARAAEARIELAYCYYRQGLFDFAITNLRSSINALSAGDRELKAVALIRLAIVERHAGRLHDARGLLDETALIVDDCSPLTKGRFHSEYATTLKGMGIAEGQPDHFNSALEQYDKALRCFEFIGNRRHAAAIENNHGHLLLTLRRFDQAHLHLDRARRLFDGFGDSVRRAQVDETLAQLYLASEQYELAEPSISLAVDTLETSGEDALLAEALTTQGLILCRLGRRYEAKPALERAQRVAARCGDYEAAGRALLILLEEMSEQLGNDERRELGTRASQLLANSQQAPTRERLRNCLDQIATAHTAHEEQREKDVHAEKMAALGELSFGVAHNVNNALTGILGRAQLLLRTNDPQKIATGLGLIIKSADDGAQIIRRIQDFARKRPTQEFQTVSIAGLLKDAWEMTRPRWEERPDSASIRFALYSDCTALVMGDPVELREVLVNMIYNAVDAMPEGGELRMSTHETKERVNVSITDTGMGMEPEVKTRLFDPFFSTKGKAGTGMGLAVSFGIIRRHDGAIEVDSEPGCGTTFRISLPRAISAEPTDLEATVPNASRLTAGAGICVLVVEDEAPVREVLIETLEAEGCQVLAAENGKVGLQLYDNNRDRLDAVFTDLSMPDINGWELIESIRKRSETIPLAIVSGRADAISWDSRNAAKADWIVSKPFGINEICEIARQIAEWKRSKAPA